MSDIIDLIQGREGEVFQDDLYIKQKMREFARYKEKADEINKETQIDNLEDSDTSEEKLENKEDD